MGKVEVLPKEHKAVAKVELAISGMADLIWNAKDIHCPLCVEV